MLYYLNTLVISFFSLLFADLKAFAQDLVCKTVGAWVKHLYV